MKLFNIFKSKAPVVEAPVQKQANPIPRSAEETFLKPTMASAGFVNDTITKSEIKYYNKGYPYACISLASNIIANTQFKLQEYVDGKWEDMDGHELLDLLNRPNKLQSGPKFWNKVAYQWLLTGNAYIKIFEASSGSYTARELKVVPNDILTILADSWGDAEQILIEGQNQDLDTIINIELHNPDFNGYGLSPIEAIDKTVISDQQAQTRHINSIDNDNTSAGIMEVNDTAGNPVSEKQLDETQARWDASHKGVENSNKIAFVTGGMLKYEKVSGDFKDLDLIKLRDFNKNASMAAYKTPPAMLGEQETSNRASADALEYIYIKNRIVNDLSMLVSDLSHALIPRYRDLKTNKNRIWFESPIPRDKDFELREATDATDTYKTIDEVRAERGLPELPDGLGQTLYRPQGEVPIERLHNELVLDPGANEPNENQDL